MVNPQIRVSPKFSELIKNYGEEHFLDLHDSGLSLAQKHVAEDRKLRELSNQIAEAKEAHMAIKQNFEDSKNQYVLDLEAELKKVKEENEHLSKILNLRSSGGI